MTKLFKNISLITLTALFFIINTGFTVSLHFCSMEKKASLSSCGMCEAPSVTDEACSDEMSSSDELVITRTPHKCCEVKLASILGTDEYLLNQIGSTNKSVQVDLIPFTFQQDECVADFSSQNFSDSSPPTETTPKLFLSNHNFRI
ncbi:MAG: hypothetical protein COW85_01890 [Ignavibacteria bacterium CG22_combo_CG10-13_8_21_14_all_37_15]|nr:MAG: hypothetical protein COW85_01890 [Ignavibacteria bacterium CG22_combo_CG10-13_8_21_14_all_37_15]PJC59744.1 MAG: hypothetical protein CO025_05285 [Ignavibacteria bacterium CG_4_9_14_0_2_um_filter_37_13]